MVDNLDVTILDVSRLSNGYKNVKARNGTLMPLLVLVE